VDYRAVTPDIVSTPRLQEGEAIEAKYEHDQCINCFISALDGGMNSAWLLRSYARPVRLSLSSSPTACHHAFNTTRTAEISTALRSFSTATARREQEPEQSHSTIEHNAPGPAPRVAIIGSGPAGFYAARKLMREVHGTKIDMYERLPTPYGLVRYGVAPDHPDVKNCQDEFHQVAQSPDYTFVGNVELGRDLPLPILAKHYHAIVFSYGASKDKEIGLEGEDKPHIYSARAFVGWYNGLPEYRYLKPDLQAGESAIVVGQGNVAMDVARILLSSVEALEKTDLTSYAIETLKTSRIKHVHVVGRRGPMQAAFTIKEVRELIHLPGVNFSPIPHHLFPPNSKSLERPKRRLMELLQKGKPHDPQATKSWSLDFLLAPTHLDWEPNDPNTLRGVTFTRTALSDPSSPSSPVSNTPEATTIPTSTLLRSIGYKAEAIPGMDRLGATFDARAGTLHHDGTGRILMLDTPAPAHASPHAHAQGDAALYCAGWVKRGPTGVIANTMTDAFQTAEAIISDWKRASPNPASTLHHPKRGWPGVKAQAAAEGHRLEKVVSWDGWHRIDEKEKRAGAMKGKPREKYGRVEDMVEAAAAGGGGHVH